VRIAVVTSRKGADHKSPVMEAVADRLASKGASLETIFAEDRAIDLGDVRVEHDLYVLKSGADIALAYGALLHDAGAKTVNPFPVTARIRDKVSASQTLAEANIPAPESFVAASPHLFAHLLDGGPIVVKPIRGSRGAGVEVVTNAEALAEADEPGLYFAQRYYEPEGLDDKVYRIGDRLFGVRRPFPARTYEEKLGAPFDLPPEYVEIADRCADAFGTELFGFDVIRSEGRAWVVDVNAFPGFKGVPEAGTLLADYILAAARG
jgi:ribosomal protein S6--L-glutamate ligase